MSALLISLFVCRALISSSGVVNQSPLTLSTSCRNVPGDPGYPTNEQWDSLNSTVSGRLVKVVPFVEFCNTRGGCTPEQSASSSFRAQVPGAMNGVRCLSSAFWPRSKLIQGFCSRIGNRLDSSLRGFFFLLINCFLGLLFGPTISLST